MVSMRRRRLRLSLRLSLRVSCRNCKSDKEGRHEGDDQEEVDVAHGTSLIRWIPSYPSNNHSDHWNTTYENEIQTF